MRRETPADPSPPPFQPMSLADLAPAVRRHLGDRDAPLRLCLQFVDDFREAGPDVRGGLLRGRPGTTGDPRWDAFVAALAEHLAHHHELPVPGWTNRQERFLRRWWFPFDLPSVRAAALARSPAAFRRRGVFITDDFFERDGPIKVEDIPGALRRLGSLLHGRGIAVDVAVFDGAIVVTAYHARLATRDIDAVFVPDTEVLEAARQVARERGWPPRWLDNQASAYLGRLPDRGRRVILDEPGIRVIAASPEHVLAMKLLAARRFRDIDDIRILLDVLQLDSFDAVRRLVAEVFPDHAISDDARKVVEDILAAPRG